MPFGYIKIHTRKFRDNAAAVDYADQAGWWYLGNKGILNKKHIYKGVVVEHLNEDQGYKYGESILYCECLLEIYQDGQVVLFKKLLTEGFGHFSLPEQVYSDRRIYEAKLKTKEMLQEFIEKHGLQYYFVYESIDGLTNSFNFYSKSDDEELVASFEQVEDARNWICEKAGVEWVYYFP